MHPFRGYISMFTDLSDHEWKEIHSFLTPKIIQKDRVILKQGNTCTKMYFLENGAIRYFFHENGEDYTIHTINPPSLFTSTYSFIHQTPSKFGIQALEESNAWMIDRGDFSRLMDIHGWNEFISQM